MVFMNVFFVLVVQHHVHLIGGVKEIRMIILVLLFYYKHLDGFLIQEMFKKKNVLDNYQMENGNFINVILL